MEATPQVRVQDVRFCFCPLPPLAAIRMNWRLLMLQSNNALPAEDWEALMALTPWKETRSEGEGFQAILETLALTAELATKTTLTQSEVENLGRIVCHP